MRIPPLGPHFIKFSKSVSYEVNLAAQSSHSEVILLSKFCPKGGILIIVDNGPLGCYIPLMLWWSFVWFPYFYSDWLWPCCVLQCAKGKSPRDEMKNNGESSKCRSTTYRSCVYKLA